MNNEGWIYIVESKLNSKKIKIGLTGKASPEQRLKNYEQYGGIKIIFVAKFNNFKDVERSLHFCCGGFYDTNVDGREWFDFSRKKDIETIYGVIPMLLAFAKGHPFRYNGFDYSNEFWRKFDNWLKEHSNDNCKKYNSFLKNKNYTDYRKFVLSKSTSEKNNKKIEKQNSKKQPKPQNKVCKYETKFDSIGRPNIDWNLFFEDHKELVGKSVYPFKKINEIGKIIKLKSPKRGANFGILYKNREMSFNEFTNENGSKNRYNAYEHIYFLDTNKTIKQVYNELKFK